MTLREPFPEQHQEDSDSGSEDDVPDGYAWIKKIDVTNWMCHQRLTIDLKESMNFIGGLNGTGKSTILAAVAVGREHAPSVQPSHPCAPPFGTSGVVLQVSYRSTPLNS